ncbi:adenylate/guanylate cyclase domain-containing protein [Bradyrhizobium sp. KBS0727]|uniref:adenylate/guanylate cyclase domain-containing protein n=1 Tax=unclassified Bradyrhizobium TaxID=2631580 RepID=UPI00110D7234|nr:MULTISPECIES: adenylate/guanylate cyclase domain-containing protein [unclassified Bradyrhizobium]QDW36071.1 adenylate/guanylate cyclase domain-containing protein [Bradyrhizobium sp. KBS0725]QDW42671.1 adenylate/guanylate cyclase domain-containing protein [Bradyrhizobium sp. KBS0727]
MKRKIAAIFAADIAGYSRLVAEDEEETLRRLASYRQVTDDFIAKGGGRIFNTAGDAVLAEFPSAVEAVRCAIDIQESLRTRNMAYPPSRQMAFRIGITIGDVVERDGDLLGDGVNIAARLEGLAEVGGICVSRAVHEQVVNKLSVQFADIGAQEVKNIPTPVHAYMVAMRREDGTYSIPQVKKPAKASGSQPTWMWPVAVTLVSLAAIGAGGFLYFTKLETQAVKVAAPAPNVSPAPSAVPAAASTPAPTAATSSPPPAPPAPSPPPIGSTEKFAAANVPFVSDKARTSLAGEYAGAANFKAFSLNIGGISAWVTAQPSEEAARTAAVEQCQKRADTAQSPRKCELYAVGDDVVYAHGKPPVPPLPWVRHDTATEQPFAAKDVPLTRDAGRTRFENVYVPGRKTKTIALGPGGAFFFLTAMDSVDEAMRRSLESCGAIAGVPCMIVALNENFVVPIPTTLRVTGFFKVAGNGVISPEARDDVAHRMADATSGWNAIAVGAAGRPGLGLKAASEQAAVNGALADCVKRDSDCHVIAIGPFSVGPN